MTPHLHSEITPGCYRCDLNLDELADARREVVEEAVHAYFDRSRATLWGRAFDVSQTSEPAEQFATQFVSEILALMDDR